MATKNVQRLASLLSILNLFQKKLIVKMKKYQIFINIYRVKQCVCKKKSNIYYYVKKRLVGVFYNREERDKDNETSLKEGGRNRDVKLQCFPYTRLHTLFRFCILLTYSKTNRITMNGDMKCNFRIHIRFSLNT